MPEEDAKGGEGGGEGQGRGAGGLRGVHVKVAIRVHNEMEVWLLQATEHSHEHSALLYKCSQ